MASQPFDAILIDFYGTICAGDREAVEAVCGRIVEACELPLTPPELAITWGECFFDLLDRCRHGAFRTLYECELESLRLTLASFGTPADPQPFVAQIEQYWVDAPVYADALDFLAQVDVPVCCVSNADTRPLTTAIEKHGLRFDAVVTSEDSMSYKPDTAIFERALELVEARPHRTVHIGDSLHADIGGAAKLGITTAWVRRESRIHDIGVCQPDFTVGSLADLPGLMF